MAPSTLGACLQMTKGCVFSQLIVITSETTNCTAKNAPSGSFVFVGKNGNVNGVWLTNQTLIDVKRLSHWMVRVRSVQRCFYWHGQTRRSVNKFIVVCWQWATVQLSIVNIVQVKLSCVTGRRLPQTDRRNTTHRNQGLQDEAEIRLVFADVHMILHNI